MPNPRFVTAEEMLRAMESLKKAVVVEFLADREIERLEAEARRLTSRRDELRQEFEAAEAELEMFAWTLKEHQEFIVYGEEDTCMVIYLWENSAHRPQIVALTTLAQDMLSNRPNPIPFKTSL